MMTKSRVSIEYCTGCRWLLRAAWFQQELLTTFQDDLQEIALIPGGGGVFEIKINNEILYSRQKGDKFPETKDIKQLIRDRIDPGRSLGHSDR